ncbi:hypothetical protein BC832DRAFT_554242 [Gaertneriomyces semiglobifer]|nr:hypothetical protein BC832DRAFT_554242 [Gaertneriomyces semiglobifer]
MFPKASRFNNDGASPGPKTPTKLSTTPLRTPRKAPSTPNFHSTDQTPTKRTPRPLQNSLHSRGNSIIAKDLKFVDIFASSESETAHKSNPHWFIEKEGLERKVRDLLRQKADWEQEMAAKTKQMDVLQAQLRQREERIRLLLIENTSLGSQVSTAENKLKSEKQKESSTRSMNVQMTSRVKHLESKLEALRTEKLAKPEMKVNSKRASSNELNHNRALSSHDYDLLQKLQKEARLFNAKLRDLQNKHLQEKRSLQAQIASMYNALNGSAAGSRMMRKSGLDEFEKDMQALKRYSAAELTHTRRKPSQSPRATKSKVTNHTLRKTNGGQAKQAATMRLRPQTEDRENSPDLFYSATEDPMAKVTGRRLSGFSDITEAFEYRPEDDDMDSVLTLENSSIDIPEFHRALQSYSATASGHLSFNEGDLMLIRKKSSEEFWVAELNGSMGLVPVHLVEHCDVEEFEAPGLSRIPAPTELVS